MKVELDVVAAFLNHGDDPPQNGRSHLTHEQRLDEKDPFEPAAAQPLELIRHTERAGLGDPIDVTRDLLLEASFPPVERERPNLSIHREKDEELGSPQSATALRSDAAALPVARA